MYIHVIDDQVKKLPYSLRELRQDNPSVSFPEKPSPSLLAEWGVFELVQTQQPSVDYTKNVVSGTPQKINGVWTQKWDIVDASEAEITSRIKNITQDARAERDRRLADTDWMVTKALETNTTIPTELVKYRQALRDVPSQIGFPHTVVWPDKPEV